MQKVRNNLIRAAADAWREWRTSEDDQFERIMLIAEAILVGRKWAMQQANADEPMGQAYAHQFSKWKREAGMADFPTQWVGDCCWLAENEPEVRSYWEKACAVRTSGLPSAHPSTLRLQTRRSRQRGTYKRIAPTQRPKFLIKQVTKILLGMREPERSMFASELAEAIETALLSAPERDSRLKKVAA